MVVARDLPSTNVLGDGRVLVAGGYGADYLDSAELYDPAAGTWTATGSMNYPRWVHTGSTLPDGRVLVVGGDGGGNNESSQTAELYDPSTETWSLTWSPARGRAFGDSATTLADGRVLVVGGENGTDPLSPTSAELYDPATGTWSVTGGLAHERVWHAAAVLA